MQPFPPTVIIRHRLENLKKCSLRGLESRPDCLFFTYPYKEIPSVSDYIVLMVDAPPLSADDNCHGILLIDATWRYAEKMLKPFVNRSDLHYRSLPHHFRTAYPRKQSDCPDPERGLASIEALYLSYLLLGRNTDDLLDNYYWKPDFMKKNKLT